MSQYEKPGPSAAEIQKEHQEWEKNIYKPFEKQILGRVKELVKAGGYHGNLDGDESVGDVAESVTRTLCALASGDARRVDDEKIKEAIQKRMDDLNVGEFDETVGGYRA